jgi:excisionase family DNA binding protein
MTGSTRTKTAGASSTAQLSEARPAAWGVREVMDIRQASEYLGISPDSLYKYASENFIPAFKLGNRWRFKRSLLERWMEQQSAIGATPAREKKVKPKQKKPVSRAR